MTSIGIWLFRLFVLKCDSKVSNGRFNNSFKTGCFFDSVLMLKFGCFGIQVLELVQDNEKEDVSFGFGGLV